MQPAGVIAPLARRVQLLDASQRLLQLMFCSDTSSLNAFYSRRIGRPPQLAGYVGGVSDASDTPENTSIIAAAKISGRTSSGYTIGILDAVTGAETARYLPADGGPEAVDAGDESIRHRSSPVGGRAGGRQPARVEVLRLGQLVGGARRELILDDGVPHFGHHLRGQLASASSRKPSTARTASPQPAAADCVPAQGAPVAYAQVLPVAYAPQAAPAGYVQVAQAPVVQPRVVQARAGRARSGEAPAQLAEDRARHRRSTAAGAGVGGAVGGKKGALIGAAIGGDGTTNGATLSRLRDGVAPFQVRPVSSSFVVRRS